MTEEDTANEDQKPAHFNLKSLFIVMTSICITLALLPLLPETAAIFMVELAILFNISFVVLGLSAKLTAGRVVANALVGSIAGALPGQVYYEAVVGFGGNGQGGLMAIALIWFGTILGSIVGGIAGGLGIGIRVFSVIRLAALTVAACIGALLVAIVTWRVIGVNDEFVVVALSTLGMLTGMWLTTDRSMDTSCG